MASPPNPSNLEEYSPSSTLILFDRPIPLLRGPIPDDPCVLAFKNPQSWAAAYKACHSQITQQCEAGARIGCSITASTKCSPPWWKTLFGFSKLDIAQRESCEQREMEICAQVSKDKCSEFAKDKCFPPFRDARIVVQGTTCRGVDLMGNNKMSSQDW